ncbi:limbic system-associated membrane protein-like isoform X1 [Acropora muricata]|uniref:limbic system-associated membrane protein-like isoform X1 n=1 Tax=Acropora muricata TaxID=159855 RepID=UPI0034E41E85
MTLVVNFLPSITEMSGNQTVTEGGNVTLKCLAYGKPTPNVTWTRISDNRIVSMPLTDITRQEAGKYKCIANNGIGSPAIGDLWIVVQCYSFGTRTNSLKRNRFRHSSRSERAGRVSRYLSMVASFTPKSLNSVCLSQFAFLQSTALAYRMEPLICCRPLYTPENSALFCHKGTFYN